MANQIFNELIIRAEAHGFSAKVEKNQLLLRADEGDWAACVSPDGTLYRVRHVPRDNEKTDRLMDAMRPECDLVREYVSRMEDGRIIHAGGDSWRELAEYDGVVLAGKYSDHGGCRFVTWRRGPDGGMNLGHYFETNYMAAKADFAMRARLVGEQKTSQFQSPETQDVYMKQGMRTKAVFKYKENNLEPRECVVEKVIPLSGPGFDAFSRTMMRDHDFLRENAVLMKRDMNDTMHCLLVIGENRQDGILVESEGASYARYAAFLPNVRDWLQAQTQDFGPTFEESTEHDRRSPALDSLCDRLNRLVDDIAITAGQTNPDQQTVVDLRDLEQEHDIEILGSAALCHTVHAMLCEHPDLDGIDFERDQSEIIFTRMDPEIDLGPNLSL